MRVRISVLEARHPLLALVERGKKGKATFFLFFPNAQRRVPVLSAGLGVEAVFVRSCPSVRNRSRRGDMRVLLGSVVDPCFDGSASPVFIGPD